MGVWVSISGHGGVILEALGFHLDVLFGVLGALGAHLDVLFWVPGPVIAKKGPRTLNVKRTPKTAKLLFSRESFCDIFFKNV